MEQSLQFETRDEFRSWLEQNATASKGVWLIFGKAGGPLTLKASEALEEALCFGWIDGQMKKVDDYCYLKYFARRTTSSKWSDKNKKLVQQLEQKGMITPLGQSKIDEAKQSGEWNKSNTIIVSPEQIQTLADILKEQPLALENFLAMSPSVQKTYTKVFLDPKTEEGKKKRLEWIFERLNKNLKPMYNK